MFLLAPLPNAVCGRWASTDDFMSETGSTVVDFGRFSTGFLVFSGVALPVVFAHNHMIGIASMIMSLSGGLLVYATIITFGSFFHENEDF
jgi:hypothetical protein